MRCSRSPGRPIVISIGSKWAITIRSSAGSMRATSSSRSTARSIPTSRVSPTLSSSSTTTTKPRSKSRRLSCKRPAFRSTLQLKAGQFFSAFGRINPTHPHTWDFADAPLVAGRLLGPDGLRGVGAQVSWTLPVSWYSQLLLGVQNGRGGTGYSFRNPGDDGVFFDRRTTDRELRGLQDFVWVPRWENSVDLSPTQIVLVGVSGAFGSNETGAHFADADLRRRSSLQMEKRTRRGRFSVREMADRSDVSAVRSRPRHQPIIPGSGNI